MSVTRSTLFELLGGWSNPERVATGTLREWDSLPSGLREASLIASDAGCRVEHVLIDNTRCTPELDIRQLPAIVSLPEGKGPQPALIFTDLIGITMTAFVFENLETSQSINRWNLSEAHVQRFPGNARPMPDKVDYQFVNGFVDTGDLPCRESWRETIACRSMVLEAVSYPDVYCGFENPRVDFSCFCFQPTVISRWANSKISVSFAQTLHFKAITCGGMYVWCDQALILIHEPYTRNTPASAEFTLVLAPGQHDITVYVDDLYERDTCSFFQIKLLNGTDVKTGLMTVSDPQRLSDIERMMAGLRTEKIFHGSEILRVTSDALPAEPVELTLVSGNTLPGQQAASDRLGTRHTGKSVSISLGKDCPVADVIAADELISGCPEFVWQCLLGDITIQRKIGTSVLTTPVALASLSAEKRREVFLQTLAEKGIHSPAYSLVMVYLNLWNDDAQNNFDLLLEIVNARDDCADFHILPLLWMATHYAQRLSPQNRQRLQAVLLGFRYWMDEPGNDVMWFWSENHVLCFHVAQYIAGELYPDVLFGNSGKTGRRHARQALERLHRWFDAIEEHGLAEWNSAAYYPIDLRGLLTLYSNGKDKDITQRARLLIDRIFQMTALHTLSGVPAGSQGRAYEKELLAGPATELGAVAAVGFGAHWYPGHDTAASLLAMSDYVVPADFHASLNVSAGQALSTSYFQGLDHHAQLQLWKSADVQLSTVCNQKSGVPGHQQHLVDLQFAEHPHARLWINHPGELQVWGEGRPSYWAGNGLVPAVAQHEDCAIMIYDLSLDANDIAFTHLFCPADIMNEITVAHANWLFARCGYGYAGVFCNGTLAPVASGLYAGSEWRLHELIGAWIVIAGSKMEHGSFEGFINHCLSRNALFCPDSQSLNITARNSKDRLSLSVTSPLTVNGDVFEDSAMTHVPQTRFTRLTDH